MRFRLTYEGPLRATQGEPRNGQVEPRRRAAHKHAIRKHFHKQLKELWNTDKFLKETTLPSEPGTPSWADQAPMFEVVANMYCENGYRFVPLVREGLHLLCAIDVLFLRRDIPGSVIEAGDVDNRLKTLIDALRKPRIASELVENEIPASDEDPFYCLLEDDKYVTKLSVETDTLLDPPNDDGSHVRLVITVDIRPYYITMLNLSFA